MMPQNDHATHMPALEVMPLKFLVVLVLHGIWYREDGIRSARLIAVRTVIHSLIFANSLEQDISRMLNEKRGMIEDTYSWSRKREYSSSPTFTGLPPYWKFYQRFVA